MGLTDFIQIQRADPVRRPVIERTRDWRELYVRSPDETLRAQGGRCMDCGVPFCQGDTGCPVQNVIPEWNALVRADRWHEAAVALHATNNFPEFTGRLCPAPCESACVLGVIEQPVAVRSIEQAIADRAIGEGWVVPRPPADETGRRVAVVGSGPAGLAAAQQLRRAGHDVIVFEKADRVGGLLRYGIPDFKMDKAVLDARVRQLADEGVMFETGVEVGVDISADTLRAEFDAVLLAGGAQAPRDLRVPGRELGGVHLAMDFLSQQNRRVADDHVDDRSAIWAGGQRVVVIGVATPARIVWGRVIARARRRSISSRCSRGPRWSGTRRRRGRSGRTSFARRTRTRRGVGASGVFRRHGFRAIAGR